jgi:ATP/maltotriose-dependent transcriptional regulator MalT
MKTSSLAPIIVATIGSRTSHASGATFDDMVEEHNRRRLRLTPRELEVLQLLCEGLPNKLIERRLQIGAGTVKCHVASILSKLGVASRLQAVVAAHRLGLLAQADDTQDDAETRPPQLVGGEAAPARINRLTLAR